VAAREAGISEATAHRRLRDPDFRRRVDELRGQALESVSSALLSMAMGAVQTLYELQKSARSERVTADSARSLIELMIATRAAADLERRLSDLESRALFPSDTYNRPG
jgi:hypothetical protein